MSTVKDILATKGTEVQTIGTDATVLEAAMTMNKHKIGALVVVDEDRLIGIFTERDVLRRVVAEQRDPAKLTVTGVMTTDVACCRSDTSIDEAKTVMKNQRIRHLPVVDENRRISGMISIGDLNAFQANSREATIHYLHQYLYERM